MMTIGGVTRSTRLTASTMKTKQTKRSGKGTRSERGEREPRGGKAKRDGMQVSHIAFTSAMYSRRAIQGVGKIQSSPGSGSDLDVTTQGYCHSAQNTPLARTLQH
jgi:hypothetical protein